MRVQFDGRDVVRPLGPTIELDIIILPNATGVCWPRDEGIRMDKGKDARRPGWFWADNKLVDVHAAKIGIHALGVYIVLVRHLNGEEEAWPSTNMIAERLDISRGSVVKAIKALADAGLIEKTSRQEDGKGQISNLYTIHRIGLPDPADAPPPVHEVNTPVHEVNRGVHQEDRPCTPDAPPPVHEVNTNKTKVNKTKLTRLNGGDPGLTEQDAAAAGLLEIGFDRPQVRATLEAIPDLTCADVRAWSAWLPLADRDNPIGFMVWATARGQRRPPPPLTRTRRRGRTLEPQGAVPGALMSPEEQAQLNAIVAEALDRGDPKELAALGL